MWGVGISIKLFDGFGRARRESRGELACLRVGKKVGRLGVFPERSLQPKPNTQSDTDES